MKTRLHVPILALIFSAMVLLPAISAAQTLPLVVDRTQTQEAYFWWSGADFFASSGPLDVAYEGAQARSFPGAGELDGLRISRVYQREDLGPDAARNLAALAGTPTFLLGSATATTHELAWVSQSSAEVTIRGTLYDTASGRQLAEIEVHGSGAAVGREAALIEGATGAWRALDTLLMNESASAGQAQMRVQVSSPEGAEPFVNYRNALERELRPLDASLQECVAREGQVTLCIDAPSGEARSGAIGEAIAALHRRDTRSLGLEIAQGRASTSEVQVRVRSIDSAEAVERDGGF